MSQSENNSESHLHEYGGDEDENLVNVKMGSDFETYLLECTKWITN